MFKNYMPMIERENPSHKFYRYLVEIAEASGMEIDLCGIRAGRGLDKTDENLHEFRLKKGDHELWIYFLYTSCFVVFNDNVVVTPTRRYAEHIGSLLKDEPRSYNIHKLITTAHVKGPYYLYETDPYRIANDIVYLKGFTNTKRVECKKENVLRNDIENAYLEGYLLGRTKKISSIRDKETVWDYIRDDCDKYLSEKYGGGHKISNGHIEVNLPGTLDKIEVVLDPVSHGPKVKETLHD